MTVSKIPLDVLRNVKTIVTHAHCPDGLASAILLHDVLPKAEILFKTHDQLASLPATEGILFCDIAPPLDRATEFAHYGAVVLDHHKTAKDAVLAVGRPGKHTMSCEEDATSRNPCSCNARSGYGVYADNETEPSVSGAVLAFRHVWSHLKRKSTLRPSEEEEIEIRNAERFAQLVGVRDTFDKRNSFDWDEAWKLSAGLMFQSQDRFLLSSSGDLFWPDEWNEWFHDTMVLGEVVNANNRERANLAIEEGFRYLTPAQKSVLIVQGLDLTTLIGDMGAADLVVGFAYRVDSKTMEPRFQVSMRSQGVVNVAAIAKAHGGGGHTNAAGFTWNRLTELNPISTIRNILEREGV